MWLWQHNKHSITEQARVALLATLLHVVAIASLFLSYGTTSYRFTMHDQAHLSRAKIVFLPLHKSVSGRGKSGAQQRRGSKSAAITQKAVQKKPGVHLTAAKQHKKTGAAAKSKKKSSAKKDAIMAKKKPAKQQPTKKEKELAKKEIKPKIEPQVAKQEAPAKVAPADAAPASAAIELTQENIQPAPLALDAATQQQLVTAVDADQDVMYVGREDLAILEMYEQLQREVVRCWRPPVGLGAQLACTIAVKIDWQGQVEASMVAQSSGVLAYDISARSSITTMTFPRSTYGKEIILTFTQGPIP